MLQLKTHNLFLINYPSLKILNYVFISRYINN